MPRIFDHLGLPVRDFIEARDWFRDTLGLEVEFEILEGKTVALKDKRDFAVLLSEGPVPAEPGRIGLWYQVDDVEAEHRVLTARGVSFVHGPEKTLWGYGAQFAEPNGYGVFLWDEESMKAKG
jgi:catechol 2,3-dioxygenase-like lactoylglutathione lyase family enzyme